MRKLVFQVCQRVKEMCGQIYIMEFLNIKSSVDLKYIEIFQQYIMITVISMDFDAISPLKIVLSPTESRNHVTYFWIFLQYHTKNTAFSEVKLT